MPGESVASTEIKCNTLAWNRLWMRGWRLESCPATYSGAARPHNPTGLANKTALDVADGVGEPCLRINAVQFDGLDQRIGDGSGFGRTF